MLYGAVGFIKVQVRAADLARAAEVLADRGPAAHDEPSDDGDDDEEPPETEGERLVRYAYRAAVMGILACPPTLHLYSLYLLLRVAVRHGKLPPAANRRFYAAFLIDLAVLTVAALVVRGVGWW
jgi:hypothetical protein